MREGGKEKGKGMERKEPGKSSHIAKVITGIFNVETHKLLPTVCGRKTVSEADCPLICHFVGLFNFSFIFICMGVLLACVFVYHMHVWCLQSPEEGMGFSGTGVRDHREPLCVLGMEPGRAARALHSCTISPAL